MISHTSRHIVSAVLASTFSANMEVGRHSHNGLGLQHRPFWFYNSFTWVGAPLVIIAMVCMFFLRDSSDDGRKNA